MSHPDKIFKRVVVVIQEGMPCLGIGYGTWGSSQVNLSYMLVFHRDLF